MRITKTEYNKCKVVSSFTDRSKNVLAKLLQWNHNKELNKGQKSEGGREERKRQEEGRRTRRRKWKKEGSREGRKRTRRQF